MTRRDLPPTAGTRWGGLSLEVEGPARPGLRVEVTGGRRLLLRQADRVVLLGLQRADHQGVYYARTGRYSSPLPAISAAHARRLREAGGDDAWAERWTHQFVDWLRAAVDGPLHAGHWTLARGMPRWAVAAHWDRLRANDRDRGHITWFGYGAPDEDARDVLPLRALPSVDAARVKAYRRQVREGILPPVLLWWVSGLNTLLLVDGHDRITAALAEQTIPEVVVLAPVADPRWIAAVQQRTVYEYERRVEHLAGELDRGDPLARLSIANVSRRLAADLGGVVRTEGSTRAWLVPGGSPAWERQAAQLAPGWAAEPM